MSQPTATSYDTVQPTTPVGQQTTPEGNVQPVITRQHPVIMLVVVPTCCHLWWQYYPQSVDFQLVLMVLLVAFLKSNGTSDRPESSFGLYIASTANGHSSVMGFLASVFISILSDPLHMNAHFFQ
jgi:hypothetical protein